MNFILDRLNMLMSRFACFLLCGDAARTLQRNALIGGGYTTTCVCCGCVREYPPGCRGYDASLAGDGDSEM